MPKISIWLTSYNHGEDLRKSIDSVLDQTYQDYEIVIVDDGSKDNSVEIINEYAAKNPKIRTIIHEKNRGGSYLIEETENLAGEYVAILHGDDAWEPEKLEKQVAILDSNPEIAACYTGVQLMGEDGEKYFGKHAYQGVFKEENRTRYEWLRYFLEKGNCLCHPSMLIRRTAYKEYSLLGYGLNSLPDFAEWIKLCLGAEIHIIPEKLTLFRVHEDESNESGETEEKQKRMFSEEYLVYQEYFKLKNQDEFLKVFPEYDRYEKEGKYFIPFAVSKAFLNTQKTSCVLLGLNTLYSLLQDEEARKELKELYDYDEKQFDKDKQKHDVFGRIQRGKYLSSSVYVDCGAGYTEEKRILKTAYIPNTGIAKIDFDMKPVCEGKVPVRIRFDLDEGIYRKCKVIKAVWDSGETTGLIAVNGTKRDEEDWFFTLDPQYTVDLTKCGVLSLELKVAELDMGEVEKYFNDMANKARKWSKIEKYFKFLKR